jgi:excisionase family DNA binding protein
MSDSQAEKRNDFLTARQLADYLQVSETTVHRLRRSGRIPAVYVTDRLVRFSLRDVRRALAKSADRQGGADRAPEPEPHRDEAQMDFADLLAQLES